MITPYMNAPREIGQKKMYLARVALSGKGKIRKSHINPHIKPIIR
jgi:hypothetical protein